MFTTTEYAEGLWLGFLYDSPHSAILHRMMTIRNSRWITGDIALLGAYAFHIEL